MENYFNEDLYNKICEVCKDNLNNKDNLIPRIEQELNRLFSDYNRFKSVKVFQYFLDINNFLILHGFKVWIFKKWELENLNDSSNNENDSSNNEIEFIFKVSRTYTTY